ncbi:hypothetical protein PsYK624_076050 [Phanerochaete sordida]|uniref:Uncharacterized protein n=1 Tax=Phanerochaete sordida TaxID=48140 RepID=A0A9P3GCQ4_9APHY|nr:hypothetical protein PsYK624_076050 [Phanerochaete sordida]
MPSSETHSTASSSGEKVFAYEYGNETLVFVQAADTFERAADLARKSFCALEEEKLQRIQFTVEAKFKQETLTRIRVSPSAWPLVSRELPKYEVLRIELPEPHPAIAHDAPPQYNTSESQAWEDQYVTYRYNDELVYVRLASNAEDAVALAQETFPALAHLPANCIRFCVSVKVRGAPGRCAVGPSAWGTVARGLSRGELMDIELELPRSREPSPALDSKPALFLDADLPPQYDAGGSGGHLDAKPRARADGSPERPRSPGVMQKARILFGGKKP